MARAFIDILDEPKTLGRIYNVAQWEIMTQRLFVEKIAAAAGCQPVVVPVPRSLFDQAGCRSTFSRPELCVEDTTRAEQDFGLRTTPVDDWVKTTVEWYVANPPEKDSAGYDRRPIEIELARWWRERTSALEAEASSVLGMKASP